MGGFLAVDPPSWLGDYVHPGVIPAHPGLRVQEGPVYSLVEGHGQLVVALLDCGSKGSIARSAALLTLIPNPYEP